MQPKVSLPCSQGFHVKWVPVITGFYSMLLDTISCYQALPWVRWI